MQLQGLSCTYYLTSPPTYPLAYLKIDGIPPLVRVVFENVLAKCLDSNVRFNPLALKLSLSFSGFAYFMNMKILGSVNQSILKQILCSVYSRSNLFNIQNEELLGVRIKLYHLYHFYQEITSTQKQKQFRRPGSLSSGQPFSLHPGPGEKMGNPTSPL